MPSGVLKNALYGAALPLAGMRPRWRSVEAYSGHPQAETARKVERAMRRAHAVGACVQTFCESQPTECYALGFARLAPDPVAVAPQTIFRTASIAKLVTAMLVIRLQTLDYLDVEDDVGELLGYPVRNPLRPDHPITLAALMSHTTGLVDSGAYFEGLRKGTPLRELLQARDAFLDPSDSAAFR